MIEEQHLNDYRKQNNIHININININSNYNRNDNQRQNIYDGCTIKHESSKCSGQIVMLVVLVYYIDISYKEY